MLSYKKLIETNGGEARYKIYLEMFQASTIIICRNVKACHYCLLSQTEIRTGTEKFSQKIRKPDILHTTVSHMAPSQTGVTDSFFHFIFNVKSQLVE